MHDRSHRCRRRRRRWWRRCGCRDRFRCRWLDDARRRLRLRRQQVARRERDQARCIGRRIGPVELRIDAIVEPLIVTTGAGDFTALFGGGASMRLRGALGGAHLIAAAGIDAFANQTEYRTAGADALTTPRIAPWLRLGVEVPL